MNDTYYILDISMDYDCLKADGSDAEIEDQSEADEISEIRRLAIELENPEPISFTAT